MTRQRYNNERYDPPAPVVLVTVRSYAHDGRQVTTEALVDTGSDVTCFPPALIRAVGGEPAGSFAVRGVGGVFVGYANSYFLEVEMASVRRLVEVVAIGDEPILGRNLLNKFVLELDGPALNLLVKS